MGARMKARRWFELDLRRAVANGEIKRHYQPVVSLARNEVCGVEALMRWHHPERGNVPPSEFVPVTEETGIIIPRRAMVLRQACRHSTQWPTHVAVADILSPVQLTNPTRLVVVVNARAAPP